MNRKMLDVLYQQLHRLTALERELIKVNTFPETPDNYAIQLHEEELRGVRSQLSLVDELISIYIEAHGGAQ